MMLKKLGSKNWLPSSLTLLSGVLIVASFPPWNLWPLLWICLIPWLIAVRKTQSFRDASIQGLWLSYFVSLGGFYWVAFVLQEFGNLPWWLSILGLQLFCFFGQLQFLLFAPLLKFLEVNNALEKKQARTAAVLGSLCLALTYTGMDWFLPKLFNDTLGHGFFLARNVRQIADLGGAALLTFLCFLLNFTLSTLLQEWRKTKKMRWTAEVVFALFLSFSAWGYGKFRLTTLHHALNESHDGIQMAAIQGNIGDFDKIAAKRGVSGAARRVLEIFTTLTNQAVHLLPRPEVIIWPETSYPSTFRNPHTSVEFQLDQYLENYVRQLNLPVLFGGYDRLGRKDYNAFFFLSPRGDLQIYRKNILLLFGEYIPGAERFDLLKEMFPQIGNFGRGEGPEVLELPRLDPSKPPIQAGPIICYEALFPDYVIAAAKKGSQVILNITNDSWFGAWGEPQLHLALTTFRSIETRLPMLRSTNTGISALVTAEGEITRPTGIGTQEILNVYVPILPAIPTLMKKWGDWFGAFSLVAGMMGNALFLIYFRSKKKKALNELPDLL